MFAFRARAGFAKSTDLRYNRFVVQRGVAQSGSALEWGSSGRPFKSGRPDQEEDGRRCAAVGHSFISGIAGRTLCVQEAPSEKDADIFVLDETWLALSRG